MPHHAHGHGGRLRAAMAAFPKAPKPWLDLSTGVNPQAYPAPRATDLARARLPDPEHLAELEAAAAGAFGCAPERVLATPGAETGIRLLAAVLEVETVAIVEPAYDGYANAWSGAEARMWRVARGPAAWDADALVLANPNNPDGAATPREVMADLARRLCVEGRWLIVDEAFVEAAPGLSVADMALDRLVVLRSFGKFYGLAGVRLGFVVGDPELIARLRARQGEWPISADAIAAGLAAYVDADWTASTRLRLDADAAHLDRLLHLAGLEVLGGTSLFRLARTPDAMGRFERLAARGVLTRPFAYAPEWLRFGLPPEEHWTRLGDALMESLG